MKKILVIVFLVVLITSCSSDVNIKENKDYAKILDCNNCGDDYYNYIETLQTVSPSRNLTQDRINSVFFEQKQDTSNEELKKIIVKELGIEDLLTDFEERELKVITIKEQDYERLKVVLDRKQYKKFKQHRNNCIAERRYQHRPYRTHHGRGFGYRDGRGKGRGFYQDF